MTIRLLDTFVDQPTAREVMFDMLRVLRMRDPVVAALAVPMKTTATGSTTTLRDTKLDRGTTDANRYNGREITRDVEAKEEASVVIDGGYDNVDQLTYSPAITTTASGDEWVMMPLGVTRQMLVSAMNETLRTVQMFDRVYPSLVSHASFYAFHSTGKPQATDLWNTVSTPSTTLNFDEAERGPRGYGALGAVADAGDEGFESNSIPVVEGESLLVSVHVRVAVGSCKVVLRDHTAGADITSVTVTDTGWMEVRFTAAVPTSCKDVRLRIVSAAASDNFNLGAYPVIQSATGRLYDLPEWLRSEGQIREWFYVPLGTAGPTTNTYLPATEGDRLEQQPRLRREDFAAVTDAIENVGSLRVQLKPANNDNPVGVIVTRPHEEIVETVGQTGTGFSGNQVQIDREYWRARSLANLLRDVGDPAARGWARMAAHKATFMGYASRDIEISANPSVAV